MIQTSRCYIILLFLLAGIPTIKAQSVDSLNAYADGRLYIGYRFSHNPATLHTAHMPELGYAFLSGAIKEGTYKRPMDPQRTYTLHAGTGGHRKLKRFSFSGDFNYQKRRDDALPWSNVHNAYNGNPFIWADSNSGRWSRDEVFASLQMSAPIKNDKLYGGLSVQYQIGAGARLNEPKPYYRIRNISLQPGVNVRLSAQKHLGLTGKLGFLQEENETGFYTSDNVLLYRLRGYGTYSRSPMVTGNRRRHGNMTGLGVDFQTERERSRWLVSAKADYRTEEVYEGIAIQSKTGYYTAYRFEGNVLRHKGDLRVGSSLEIGVTQENGYADDYAFKSESATHDHTQVSLQWRKWWMVRVKDLLQWQLHPVYKRVSFTDLATKTYYEAAHAGVSASLLWRHPFSSKFFMKASPHFSYMPVIAHHWENGQANTVINTLIKPHYEYLATGFWQAGYSASFGLRTRSGRTHIINLQTQYYAAHVAGAAGYRLYNQLQYSILF